MKSKRFAASKIECSIGHRWNFHLMLCVVSILIICCFMTSCTTKATQRTKTMGDSMKDDNYGAMVNDIKAKGMKLYGETNAYLYNMDIGVLYHYMDEYDSSNVYLQKAADIYYDLFTKSVTNEAAALLTNDNVRPYRSKPYELIALHQIKFMNYLVRGDVEGALVESRKAQIYFNEWEGKYAKDKKYYTDGMAHLYASLGYEANKEQDNSLISLFKSVSAYKLGPVKLPPEVESFAYNRLKAGDRPDDIKLLNISYNDDENEWDAKDGQSEIIIVSYVGKGPNLREVKWYGTYSSGGRLRLEVPVKERGYYTYYAAIDLPAPPLPDGNGSATNTNITVALPNLQTFPSKTSHFTAQLGDGSKTAQSVVVNDFNLQAQKALDDVWGDIVMRTVVRVVVRTIAATKTKQVSTGNASLDLLKHIATDVTAHEMEKADIRMCFLLPKQIHIARIPVDPGTHSITLNTYDTYGNVIGRKVFNDVDVKKGEKKTLLHRSLR